MGTSTVTTYIESAAGIAEGRRTGLTSVVVVILFLLALFFSPLALSIPGAATAPALIIVGVLMMSAIRGVDLENFTEAFPAFVTLAVMPFTFSIAEGIAAGRAREVHWFLYVLCHLPDPFRTIADQLAWRRLISSCRSWSPIAGSGPVRMLECHPGRGDLS